MNKESASATCQVCRRTVDEDDLSTCKSCGRHYCPSCQNSYTKDKICCECGG